MHPTETDLARRITVLERRHRRLRILCGAAIICLSILGMAAARSGATRHVEAEEVRAQRFVLVDADGKIHGDWDSSQEG